MRKQNIYKLTLIHSLFGPKKSPFDIDKCAQIALGKRQKSLRFAGEVLESASVQSNLALIFSRRFSREKCPTLTVASFFFVRLQSHSAWATFLTIETTKTTSIRPSPVSGN